MNSPLETPADTYPALTFSHSAWTWFSQACKEMEIPVSEEKRPLLEALYSHLLHVNTHINLTRITAPDEYLKFHILDSLTPLRDIAKLTRPGDICLDLGSGGGYPGLPLILWLPDRNWVLLDSRQKKAAFLAHAIELTRCPRASARAFRAREAQNAAPDLAGRCALIIARAVGPMPRLMLEAAPLLKRGAHLLALKGPAYDRDERRAVTEACHRLPYRQVDELAIHLDPDDPRRLILIFARQ